MGTADQGSAERRVILGHVGGAFGVAGWVKLKSYTDPPGNILRFPVWWLRRKGESHWREVRLIEGCAVASGLRARLEGITTREAAAAWRGAEIGVWRNELPALGPGEVYWDDLPGLMAYSTTGERLGEVADIRASPAHPLLRIMTSDARELLVPLVRERIKSVDLAARRLVVDWQSEWLR